ncbi:hypothetical protein [Spirosoma sp.]|uniref:hypothetical protein n=1 Tax=Spirosoma sp. TaxID=1899569 RepID=UPI002604CE01|nr:hypothetical protein [Spirosoma sp.]MCX6216569.1 hypothetical protein [Spirosoma sp.]
MILRAILFWLVWILAAPLVFLYYLSRGFKTSAFVLTGLVKLSIWERFVTRKAEASAELLADRRVKNFVRDNPYSTRK